MHLPADYCVQKFYQYAGYPKFNRLTQTHQGSCPICREGKSWGRKKRCYFVLKDNVICCHNCGWFSAPLKWIETAGNMSYNEIIEESKTYDVLPLDLLSQEQEKPVIHVSKLPKDSINLFDAQQVEFYKDSQPVKTALQVIRNRRLDTAINRPPAMFISLLDKVHKNRLVIPFYNENNDIIFYQSRTILPSDSRVYPKYLSKVNSEKSLCGINNIDNELNFLFIFEGPIDSFFIKNGIAVAGIQENSSNTFTTLQNMQLQGLKLLDRIWVLDSQWLDLASRKKTEQLIKQGETVFIWPEKIGKAFKDVNEMCIAKSIDSIPPNFIIKNSFTGLRAELAMVEINRYLKK